MILLLNGSTKLCVMFEFILFACQVLLSIRKVYGVLSTVQTNRSINDRQFTLKLTWLNNISFNFFFYRFDIVTFTIIQEVCVIRHEIWFLFPLRPDLCIVVPSVIIRVLQSDC